MRPRLFAVALGALALAVSSAVAAPPLGKGKPEAGAKPATTGVTVQRRDGAQSPLVAGERGPVQFDRSSCPILRRRATCLSCGQPQSRSHAIDSPNPESCWPQSKTIDSDT